MARAERTMDWSRDLVLSVDGPGVRPDSVDVALFLELGASFFQLVKANAGEEAASLDLIGIRILDKCVALSAGVSSVDVARACAEEAVRQIAGEEAPRGLPRLVDRVRGAVRRLPAGHTARVLVGPWVKPIVVSQSRDLVPFDAILSIRAVPLRAGGKRPAVRFQSNLEGEFTLDTKADQARALGAHLYEEVDITARVARDSDGAIAGGQLQSFECVEASDPTRAWREWYRVVGGAEWDEIEDLGTELRR